MSAPLALLTFLAAASRATQIEPIPALSEPVSAISPVVTQLRADLISLQAPVQVPDLAPTAVLATPSAFATLQRALDEASRPQTRKAEFDALRRVELAQTLLRRLDPEKFASLPANEQGATLERIWSGWKDRGLIADAAGDADPAGALDRLIVAGVEDRALTSANKSVFLAAGVLGYPLEDALWLQRTRISDALDENKLHYPSGQKWHTADHTPEFLGATQEGQRLVDLWGAAAERAKELVKGGAPKTAVEKSFAGLVAELRAAGDEKALAYLSGEDPTFTAFLLDARKPGYFLYNGDGSIVARIMSAKAARALGVRRLDKPDGDAVHASTYFYRPARVAERLREVGGQTVGPHDQDARERIAEYARRAAALAARLSRPE